MTLRHLIAFSMLGATSCAAMMNSYRETYCNYDGAYKKGMNDAQSRQAMAQDFADPCFNEQKAQAERGYREGYNDGLAHRDPVYRHRRDDRDDRRDEGRQLPCDSSNDCSGSGAACKDRGDGVMLCMNHEPTGNYCDSGIDCGQALLCRGDNVKTCQP